MTVKLGKKIYHKFLKTGVTSLGNDAGCQHGEKRQTKENVEMRHISYSV